jgi:hypothetical protein
VCSTESGHVIVSLLIATGRMADGAAGSIPAQAIHFQYI